ncbi:unnamed protein product [Rotaria magnacalcarata]|uniref:Major vault protein n=1 Tax=Rotaria magnacalcarata TaxID=392030 RepID=A0A8S2JRR6_9BILA|nr:unnamed protein product [Rotaria magnacalcarata]
MSLVSSETTSQKDTAEPVYRIPPCHYIHVLDQNTNVTRLEVGPKTFIKQDNETVTMGPEKMIIIPLLHYCIVESPVVRSKDGEVEFDQNGQVKLAHADFEIHLSRPDQTPFPLYPGEILRQPVTAITIVPANAALRLKAVLDFEDSHKERRRAGDEWMFEGPATYIPRKEINVEEQIQATIIGPNQAIRLRAKKELIDRSNQLRVTGEEWLIKKAGAYLPLAYETVVLIHKAYALTDKKALHLRALKTFTDDFGKMRLNGEEWLVTHIDAESHILNVYEELIADVDPIILNSREYCIIMDPSINGKSQLGQKKMICGESSFFLQPGEKLLNGIQNVFVLGEDEGITIKCNETFNDEHAKKVRVAGDRWIVRGPIEYIPPTQVEVITRPKAIPLDENEGIYVRNIKTGRVQSIIGVTYMLTEDEELWKKELPEKIEYLLTRDPLTDRYSAMRDSTSMSNVSTMLATSDSQLNSSKSNAIKRDKWRLITYRVPHNAAVQIYDYKVKKTHIVFGPELVMLEPDEHFTMISLSGGIPKKPNQITTNSQEAAAQHEASRREQEAKGVLERQPQSAVVESAGQSKAEAFSRAESKRIEGIAAVELACLKAKTITIEAEAESTRLKLAHENEIKFLREQNELEIRKKAALSQIETEKFKLQVESIGASTIQSIAMSGPETQVKLLQALGLQSMLVTDGRNPINLIGFGQGLIGDLTDRHVVD